MTNLKICPFGGVGEIGSNMTIFETENHVVIIDYGILFPYEDFFDINYLIADTTQINQEKEITLFITHGHEDHIGAVSHILTEMPQIKVIAPNFAKILIEAKLEKRKLSRKIQTYNEDTILKFDEFELHPVHVTHSIPETFGIIFRNEKLATLFISDFKFDLKPLFEEPINVNKIKNVLGKSDKSLVMLDSTNILGSGKTLSESDLSHDLNLLIKKKKRTFITLFSSNIYRIKNILEHCKKHKKRVVTIGRSIQFYLDAAEKANLLLKEDYPIFDLDAVQNHNAQDLVYIVTGSQGEHLGATRRIVIGEQKYIQLNKDDQFIFSSKTIPGNEKKVYRLYNSLAEQEVDIIDFKTHQIHASGHPCQEDLKLLVSEISPDYYVPIHGETHFLRKHIEFIDKNFPNTQSLYLENYQGIEFKNGSPKTFLLQQNDPHLIHGKDLIIEREKISERRKIANNGAVFISLNHKTQAINVSTKGLPNMVNEYILKLKDLIDYCAFVENKKRDHDYTIEQVRIKTRTFLNSILGYKPITIVHLV